MYVLTLSFVPLEYSMNQPSIAYYFNQISNSDEEVVGRVDNILMEQWLITWDEGQRWGTYRNKVDLETQWCTVVTSRRYTIHVHMSLPLHLLAYSLRLYDVCRDKKTTNYRRTATLSLKQALPTDLAIGNE